MADSPIERSRRLQSWRGETRKILRDKLNAEKAIDDIALVDKTVREKWQRMSAPQVGALKLLADNSWRKLAKVLPDVKAVEVDIGEHSEESDRDVLLNRIAALHRRATERLERQRAEGAPASSDGSGATH